MVYDAVVVCPGFEQNDHPSGLFWDTRYRLSAAAELFLEKKAKRIVVGGGRLRNMYESFAVLMKKYLVRGYDIPTQRITTEEQTFDTASQIDWLMNHPQGSVAIVTDKWQALHIRALLFGYRLENIQILTVPETEYTKLQKFKWALRESALAVFTILFDHRGKIIQRITSGRRTSN